MINVSKTNMQGKALLQLNDKQMVAYYKGQIVIYENEVTSMKILLPMPWWKRYACRIRLLERALHTDVRWATNVSDNEIIFLFQNAIYKANLTTGEIYKEFEYFKGQPFSVTHIGDRILMGDYGTNKAKEAVHIYERIEGTWRIVFTFPGGTIRHIHNIIPDNDCFFVLTGDEDHESGIWMADNGFKHVKPLLIGKQQYRCCQLLKGYGNGGWFLTDAPSESNWLYHFSDNETEPVCEIPGTVIYGTKYNDSLLFSTTVEPEAHAKNKIEYWITSKPGAGIKNNATSVYLLKDGNLHKVISYVHDGKPLRLFQYASVYFCNVIDGRGYLTATSVRHYDNMIMKIEFT